MALALVKIDAFNSHSNSYRCDKGTLGAMPAPAILKKDEVAYARAMEKAAMGKRKVKVTLAEMPF